MPACKLGCRGGDVAQLIERRRRLRRFNFPVRQGIFLPEFNFQYRLSYGVRTALVFNRMR